MELSTLSDPVQQLLKQKPLEAVVSSPPQPLNFPSQLEVKQHLMLLAEGLSSLHQAPYHSSQLWAV